jgi:hypothetical protein
MSFEHRIEHYQALGADCKMFSTGQPDMNEALWRETRGDVCRTGCAWYSNGGCTGYRRLHGLSSGILKTQPFNINQGAAMVETVKQQAAREGISIAEVRRRRKEA